MAERRPAGALGALVLALIERAGSPVSASALATLLHREGARIHKSQAYRLLRDLWRRRRVQRIELLSAYVAGETDRQVALVCRHCRAFRAVRDEALFARIDGVAQTHGFSVARYVVEVACDCPACWRDAG